MKSVVMTGLLRKLKRLVFPVYSSPQKYWRKRYVKFGTSLTGPGCVGLDDKGNEGDYAVKWDHISRALALAGKPEGQSLLDAGCGVGAFTQRFMSAGYSVSAVDFAANAIESARKRIGESVTWYVDVLGTFYPGPTFDVVVSIDVLFHVTDDQLFRRAVLNLAALTKPRGLLLIQDHLVPEDEVVRKVSARASHVRWRSIERYKSILGPEWHLLSLDHYELPVEKDTKDVFVFAR